MPDSLPPEPCWAGERSAGMVSCSPEDLWPSTARSPSWGVSSPLGDLPGRYAFTKRWSSTLRRLCRDGSRETQPILETGKDNHCWAGERGQLAIRHRRGPCKSARTTLWGVGGDQPGGKARLGVWVDSTPTPAQKSGRHPLDLPGQSSLYPHDDSRLDFGARQAQEQGPSKAPGKGHQRHGRCQEQGVPEG